MRAQISIVLLLAAVVSITACDQGEELSPEDAVATNEVDVVDNRFEPAVIAVETGDTVTWTWGGETPHDVTGDDFASETQTDGTFTHTFETSGQYQYRCTIHSGMNGLVVVED